MIVGPGRIAGRFSIGRLMLATALIAVDCAILRWWFWEDGWGIALILLPPVNLLVWTCPRVRPGWPTRRFWVAYQAVGWALVVGGEVWRRLDLETFFGPILRLHEYLGLLNWAPVTVIAAELGMALGLYLLPQLLLAWLAGWLADRYTIVRRRPPTTRSGSPAP